MICVRSCCCHGGVRVTVVIRTATIIAVVTTFYYFHASIIICSFRSCHVAVCDVDCVRRACVSARLFATRFAGRFASRFTARSTSRFATGFATRFASTFATRFASTFAGISAVCLRLLCSSFFVVHLLHDSVAGRRAAIAGITTKEKNVTVKKILIFL